MYDILYGFGYLHMIFFEYKKAASKGGEVTAKFQSHQTYFKMMLSNVSSAMSAWI